MSSIERKSAAVMFTDIAGYTSVMASDEEKALSLLQNKRNIIKPLIEEHNGIYVKGTGDGTLSYFDSAYKASKCAKVFQETIYNDNNMNVRVGIHIGDIVFEDEDVYGDGVNVAARLENMAPVGGICVSNTVYDELRNKKEFDGINLGLQSLKGVGRLVEVFGLKGEKLEEPNPLNYKENQIDVHKDDEVPSIAVIPFDNKGADEDIFYAYGISSDLISDIAGAGLIRVASLKEIEELGDMPFKEKAKQLISRYVCTGALWKMNDMFQLSIELYDMKHSKVVWSDRWQENWTNLTTIKETLSKNLLEALNKKSHSIELLPDSNTEAYEFYLKGKYKIEQAKNLEDIAIGEELLRKSIDLDPNQFEARYCLIAQKLQKGIFSDLKNMSIEIIKFAEKSKNKRHHIHGYKAHVFSLVGKMFESGEEELDPDSDTVKVMHKYTNDGINLCLEINDLSLLRDMKHLKLAIYSISGEKEKAVESSKELLENYKKVNDTKGIAKTSFLIAQSYEELGQYDKAMELFTDSISYAESTGDPARMTNVALLSLKIIQKDNVDEEYQKCNELIQDSKAIEAKLVLRGAYLAMLQIQIRRGEYSKIPGIYEKYKKVQNDIDCPGEDDNNFELSFSNTILALSKKLLGDKNAPEIKELKKLAEKNEEGLNNFWQNYFLYQLLGSKKGKKFLKLSHDKIEELQSNLKGNELKSFLNTYYVKLILEEWEKINN